MSPILVWPQFAAYLLWSLTNATVLIIFSCLFLICLNRPCMGICPKQRPSVQSSKADHSSKADNKLKADNTLKAPDPLQLNPDPPDRGKDPVPPPITADSPKDNLCGPTNNPDVQQPPHGGAPGTLKVVSKDPVHPRSKSDIMCKASDPKIERKSVDVALKASGTILDKGKVADSGKGIYENVPNIPKLNKEYEVLKPPVQKQVTKLNLSKSKALELPIGSTLRNQNLWVGYEELERLVGKKALKQDILQGYEALKLPVDKNVAKPTIHKGYEALKIPVEQKVANLKQYKYPRRPNMIDAVAVFSDRMPEQTVPYIPTGMPELPGSVVKEPDYDTGEVDKSELGRIETRF